jgi:hypothetical protein
MLCDLCFGGLVWDCGANDGEQRYGLLSSTDFWAILGCANPFFLHNPNSLWSRCAFSIFDVQQIGQLTCLEFLLAVAVLADRRYFTIEMNGFCLVYSLTLVSFFF